MGLKWSRPGKNRASTARTCARGADRRRVGRHDGAAGHAWRVKAPERPSGDCAVSVWPRSPLLSKRTSDETPSEIANGLGVTVGRELRIAARRASSPSIFRMVAACYFGASVRFLSSRSSPGVTRREVRAADDAAAGLTIRRTGAISASRAAERAL